MSYEEARARYTAGSGHNKLFELFTRMIDFDILDYEIEEVDEKPTAEQVERILDDFNQRLVSDDCYYFARVGHMRDAIRHEMGSEYLDR